MGRQPATRSAAGAPALSKAEASPPVALSLVVSLRPSQWTKNLVVFAALLFGRELLDARSLGLATAAFFIFCALSGVVYLVNDVVDRENDRQHPVKKYRPIAAGHLAPSLALTVAFILGAAALGAAAFVGRDFLIVAASYLGLLSLYSGPLKHAVIIDVMTIAIGFVLRAVGGAVAIAVPISHWLLVCTILLALFLALSKRRHELVLLQHDAKSHRRILHEYSPYLLDQMIAVVAAATLVSYALYTVSPETIERFGTDRLLLTLPFPIYGLFRYLYLVHQKQGGGSPAEMLLTDRPLLACVALWVVAVGTILYHPFGLQP